MQESNYNAKLFSKIMTEKSDLTIEKNIFEQNSSYANMNIKLIKERFRSEDRKSDLKLKLEQKRFAFLNESVYQKYEEEILGFFDEFTESKVFKQYLNKLIYYRQTLNY